VAVIERLIEQHGIDFVEVPPDASLQEVLRLAAALRPSDPSSVFVVLHQGSTVSWIRVIEIVTFLEWTSTDGLNAPATALPMHITDRVISTSDPASTDEIVEDLTSIEGQVFVIQNDKAQQQIVGVLYNPSLSGGKIDFGAANLRGIFDDFHPIDFGKRAKKTTCPHCAEANFPKYELVERIWVCPACKQPRELR